MSIIIEGGDETKLDDGNIFDKESDIKMTNEDINVSEVVEENADNSVEVDEATNEKAAEEVVEEIADEEACDAPEEDSEETSEETSDDEADSEKKGIFAKRKEKEKEKLKERIKELEEGRIRQLAEFENFRNRSEKEKSQRFDMGASSVIEKMLPVVDNFERALQYLPEGEESKAFVEGVQGIFKQLNTVLDELGVKPIDAVGKKFNPDFHSAVMMVDDEEKESGTVAEELQKGYLYHDNVVRHSMVKVVN